MSDNGMERVQYLLFAFTKLSVYTCLRGLPFFSSHGHGRERDYILKPTCCEQRHRSHERDATNAVLSAPRGHRQGPRSRCYPVRRNRPTIYTTHTKNNEMTSGKQRAVPNERHDIQFSNATLLNDQVKRFMVTSRKSVR